MYEQVVVVPLHVAAVEVVEEALKGIFQLVGPIAAKGGVSAPAYPLGQASCGGVTGEAERCHLHGAEVPEDAPERRLVVQTTLVSDEPGKA